jgi:hypothetical protein
MKKTLIVYVFHSICDRVHQFIRDAIFNSDDVDFVMVANNETDDLSVLQIPSYVRLIRRPNVGMDFGGWSAVVRDGSYMNYEQFIFTNSTVSGPYLPAYMARKEWPDIFLRGLSERVWLVGATINGVRDPMHLAHVQSYIFAIKRETVVRLVEAGIFNDGAKTREEAVGREIAMSRAILRWGGDIDCLMGIYRGGRWRLPQYSSLGDLMFPQHYRTIWTEYDVVFPKGNRGIPIPSINPSIQSDDLRLSDDMVQREDNLLSHN